MAEQWGLSEFDRGRLRAGASVTADGYTLWLENGQLKSSRGGRPDDFWDQFEAELRHNPLTDAEALRQEQLKMRVRSAVLTGGSLAFGDELSEADFDLAFDELQSAIDWVKDAEENPPSPHEVREYLPSMQHRRKGRITVLEEQCDGQ